LHNHIQNEEVEEPVVPLAVSADRTFNATVVVFVLATDQSSRHWPRKLAECLAAQLSDNHDLKGLKAEIAGSK